MANPSHPANGIIDHRRVWQQQADGSWVEHVRTPAELTAFKPTAEQMVRVKRDELLADSDKMVLPDRWESYTNGQKTAWTVYRQQLRDLPNQMGFPYNLTWPVKP